MNPVKVVNSAAKYIENEDDLEKFLKEIEFDINDLYPDERIEIINNCNNKILSNYIIDNIQLVDLIDYVRDIEYDNIDTSIANKISSKVQEFAENVEDVDIIENILFKSGVIEWGDKNIIDKFLKGDLGIYLDTFPTVYSVESECKVKSLLDENTIISLLKIYCKNNNGYITAGQHGLYPGFALTLYAIGHDWLDISGDNGAYNDMNPEHIIDINEYIFEHNRDSQWLDIISEYGYSLNPEEFKKQTTNYLHDANYIKMVGDLLVCDSYWWEVS